MAIIKSVLIISKYGTFTIELINKLNKEGWRIFTLTGDSYGLKPTHVFEQYRFSYDSDSMNEILASCLPNVIIFAGAYDPAFHWRDESEIQDSRLYMAGLNNILISARDQNIKHFIYISSECVFENSYKEYIVEDTEISPHTVKATTIAQGEALATLMAKTSPMEVSIARMGDMYFIPKDKDECRDYITNLCLEAISTGKIEINSKIVKSALYIGDAIQALFILMTTENRDHTIYHISSQKKVNQLVLGELIAGNTDRPVTIQDESTGLTQHRVLSNHRFSKEYDFDIHTNYSQAVPRIIAYMEKNRSQFNIHDYRHFNLLSWLRGYGNKLGHLFPMVEVIVFFLVFFNLNKLASNISYIQGIDLYLIFVLTFAIIRGRLMAMVAFALAIGGHFYEYIKGQGMLEFFMEIETYIWIGELFVVGIVAGHLRDKLIQLQVEREEEREFLMGRIEDISFINETNVMIKNYFQERFIDSNESIGWFYDIISKLEDSSNYEVGFKAIEVVSKVMGSHDVAIYTTSKGKYYRLMASTTARARTLGKSISKEEYADIFGALTEKETFVNKALSPDLPSIASILTGEDGVSQVLFLIWDLPYERMTLYYINTLKVLGSLIYNAMLREARYLSLMEDKRLVPNTSLILKDEFHEIWSIYEKNRSKELIEYSMLTIPMGDVSTIEWSNKLVKLLRDGDIIGLLADNYIGVLLTNTARNEVGPIIKRMKDADIQVNTIED